MMLRVTIANIDRTYIGIYNEDDVDLVAQQALKTLVTSHGFFDENEIVKMNSSRDDNKPYGMLVMPDQKEGWQSEGLEDDENTYLIWVCEYASGTMINVD